MCLTQHGITTTVVIGELAKQSTNVVVVAAGLNVDMTAGSASEALLKEAGSHLQAELNQKYKDGIKVGEIAVASGHRAPCDNVFVINIPTWSEIAKKIFTKTIWDCLKKLDEFGYKSISFGTLGCGRRMYPVYEVANMMLDAIGSFGLARSRSTKVDINIVINKHDEFKYKEDFQDVILMKFQGRPFPLSHDVVRGDVRIELVSDDIVNQKVDVIVCATSPSRSITEGVCGELSKIGGKQFRKHFREFRRSGSNGVFQIPGDKFQCKVIYIAALPHATSNKIVEVKRCFKNTLLSALETVIRDCLDAAASQGHRSIGFTAMGTGILKYEATDVCYTMYKTVVSWACENRRKSLNVVRFVLLPSNYDLNMIFRRYARTINKRTPPEKKESDTYEEIFPLDSDKEKLRRTFSSLIEIEIISDNMDNIKKCKTEVEKMLAAAYAEKKITGYKKIVQSLSFEERYILEEIVVSCVTEVDMEIDNINGVIKIEGLEGEVLNVLNRIWAQLMKLYAVRCEEEYARILMKSVVWSYECMSTFTYVNYDEKINYKLEFTNNCQRPTCVFKNSMGDECVADFQTMTEYRKNDPTNITKIQRKPAADGQLYKFTGTDTFIPKHWVSHSVEEMFKLTVLSPGNGEYRDVIERFRSGSPSIDIHVISKVSRVQNIPLFIQYKAQKDLIGRKFAGDTQLDRKLWFWASDEEVSLIMRNGFNRNRNNGSTRYGEGVHFYADVSSLLQKYAKAEGSLILANVITGQYTQGHKHLRVLPPVAENRNFADDSPVTFNSAVDNCCKPRVFVIFNDTQAYPAYLLGIQGPRITIYNRQVQSKHK